MKKLIRLFNTIKYLKRKQFFYRFIYTIRNNFRKLTKYNYPKFQNSSSYLLILKQSIPYKNLYKENIFTFIGISHKFSDNKIDWNYNEYGRLWNYNLTYFEFLNQEDMTKEQGLELIKNYINYPQKIRGSRVPYPISLRNINIIKFISFFQIRDQIIDDFLFAQYNILMDNLEYHILGNHLLENGFSLLFGAYYFRDERLYRQAFQILEEELEEQILDDGAHFELTPMYHQLMLFRVLDCINLVSSNNWQNKKLLTLLEKKAEKMLGWLQTITFKDGAIPLFNDSTNGIAPTTRELVNYASSLNIKEKRLPLSQSGYRKKITDNYECIVDVGNIGPDYIPGHAHSDTFNFELYIKGEPIIVDRGISTYEANETRILERSTSSHNTVEIDRENQSDVWGGFRVARRAKIIHLTEDNNIIQATHNGYQHRGYFHTRQWKFLDNKIVIDDLIEGKSSKGATAYLHFHPNIEFKIEKNRFISQKLIINFKNIDKLRIKRYNHFNNFNYKKTSSVLILEFKEEISMEIDIL